jgi:hypothetical protein
MLLAKNAEIRKVFRRIPGNQACPKRLRSNTPCQPLFCHGVPNPKNHWKISEMCHWHHPLADILD